MQVQVVGRGGLKGAAERKQSSLCVGEERGRCRDVFGGQGLLALLKPNFSKKVGVTLGGFAGDL